MEWIWSNAHTLYDTVTPQTSTNEISDSCQKSTWPRLVADEILPGLYSLYIVGLKSTFF
jgi:hypothetical protein